MRKNPRIEFNQEKLQYNVTTIYNMCAAKESAEVGPKAPIKTGKG